MESPGITIAIAGPAISRREALTRLSAIALGIAAAGCAPAAIAGRALYPEAAALDDDAIARGLTAFVATVIPEPGVADAVARRFADPFLRFAPHRGEFVADLMRRADLLARTDRFDRLSADQRRTIVQAGLDGGAVTGRLYGGAVFLAQIVYYSGLWNERGDCAFIGYDGGFTGGSPVSYDDPEPFLPEAITADGNPA